MLSFLRRNNLPQSDFYDVAALGYLGGIRRYLRDSPPYSLGTICWRDMRNAVSREFRFMRREKRRAPTFSLYGEIPGKDGLILADVVADPAGRDVVDLVDSAVRLNALWQMATPTEREVFCFLASGFLMREAAPVIGVSTSTVSRTAKEFRKRVALCLPWVVPDAQREIHAYRERFSRHLKSLIEARGLSLNSLARKTGISSGPIKDYVQGRYMPGTESLQKLADALGVSLESMYPPPTEKQKPPRRNGDGFKKERFDCHHSTGLA
ncbi:MAG: helix-turn-helix domain-containing protein [Clostridiales Family XIII bacterium]|nr:helix-turn-helix domain-containing protein [Clostridiales Family XIII bacterium]